MLSMKWEPKSIFKLLCDKYVDIRNCFYCWDCCFSFQFQSIGFSSLHSLNSTPSLLFPSPPPRSIPVPVSPACNSFLSLFSFQNIFTALPFSFLFHPIFTHTRAHTHTERGRERAQIEYSIRNDG